MSRIALVMLALAMFGCAGSLVEARPPRSSVGVDPARVEHCDSLDKERRVESGLAKAFALVGGTSGLATIPVNDSRLEVGLAIGAIGSAAVAVGLQVVSDMATTSWAAECTK